MKKYVTTLLVVLALSACLLAVPAGAGMRVAGTGEPTAIADITGTKDGGGNIGGDDDRWGDATPSIIEPDPEAIPGGTSGGDIVATSRPVLVESVMALRLRVFLSTAVILLGAR